MLFIVGAIFLALGLLSGGVLLYAGLGLAAIAPGWTLWAAFPALILLGFSLLAAQASLAQVRAITSAVSVALLLMAVGALVVVILHAASLLQFPTDGAALWYVVFVGGLLGIVGAATMRRQPAGA